MGFLRLFLALSVVAGHTQSTVFGFRGAEAYYAVNVFFIISGFYMAMVLNEKYNSTPVIVFYKSRALRLYPIYYIGLIFSLLISWPHFVMIFQQLSSPSKIFMVIQNAIVFGQDFSQVLCSPKNDGSCMYPVEMTVNPPAWSLSVELIFYIMAPFIVKSVTRTYIYFLIGAIYLIFTKEVIYPVNYVNYFQNVATVNFIYHFYPSSFIFFAGGAIAYHISKNRDSFSYLATVSLAIALSFVDTIMPFWHLFIVSASIPVLFNLTKNNKADRMLGELSFPAYIFHFPALRLLDQHPDLKSWTAQYISYGSLVALSSCAAGLLVHFLIERYIDHYRHEKLTEIEDGIFTCLIKYLALPTLILFPFACLLYIITGNK